jgi:CxxC motif-containing protein (DUF1111 family)
MIALARTSLLLVPLLAAPLSPSLARAQGTLPGVGQLGGPATDLPPAQMARFLRGRALFDKNFHRSSGLGTPDLNADSCRACHQDPLLGGSGGLELNVSRFARDNGGLGPFQNLPGGQAASKMRPPYVGGREEYDDARADVFEQRQTPSIFGLGLLDAIPEAEILAHEDPTDANGDGVKGVARRVTVGATQEIGRFGWKAQVPRLSDFVRDAMAGEIGITTGDDGRGFALLADADAVSDPELDEAGVADVAFFMANLAAPARVGSLDPQVTAGELVFEQLGCAKCHRPELAGPDGPVRAYTDLLLHRVMPGSYRGMSEPGAGMGVFRTPPLWGIRLTAPYLHDGRAEDLRAAIVAHAAEAQGSKLAYQALPALDQDALIAFLEDL